MYRVIDRHGNVQRVCETQKRAEKLCRRRKDSLVQVEHNSHWFDLETCKSLREKQEVK